MTGGGTGREPQDAPGASSRVESNIKTSVACVVGGRRLRGDGEAYTARAHSPLPLLTRTHSIARGNCRRASSRRAQRRKTRRVSSRSSRLAARCAPLRCHWVCSAQRTHDCGRHVAPANRRSTARSASTTRSSRQRTVSAGDAPTCLSTHSTYVHPLHLSHPPLWFMVC